MAGHATLPPLGRPNRTVGTPRPSAGSLPFETGSHKKSPGFDCCLDRAHPVSESDRTVGSLRLVVGSPLSTPAFTFSERGCSPDSGDPTTKRRVPTVRNGIAQKKPRVRLLLGSSAPGERDDRTVGCLRLVAGSLPSVPAFTFSERGCSPDSRVPALGGRVPSVQNGTRSRDRILKKLFRG